MRRGESKCQVEGQSEGVSGRGRRSVEEALRWLGSLVLLLVCLVQTRQGRTRDRSGNPRSQSASESGAHPFAYRKGVTQHHYSKRRVSVPYAA